MHQEPDIKRAVRDMKTEEKFPEKRLYKLLLGVLKVIPMLLAISAMAGMFFDFFGLDGSAFSFFGGVSLLPLMFIYLASYVFRFCEYHRMFLHYVVANNLLTFVDYFFGVPISNEGLLMLHLLLIGLFLFLVLYFYKKEKCCKQ